jgi:hypothetical protein
MSGAVVTVAVVVVASACGGSPSHPTSAADRSGADASSASPGVSAPATTSSTGASPGAGATAAASTAAGASGGPHTVAVGPGSSAPGKPTGFTRAGSYVYDVAGTVTTPMGTQHIAGTESLAEDAPQRSRQHSNQTSTQGGNQEQTLEVRPAGLYVDDIAIHQQGFDEDFKPIGTALYFPSSYHAGQSWKWSARSTDGKYRIDVSSRIVSTSSSVALQGKVLKALIVDSTLRISGKGVDVTDKQRDWVSTTYALILRDHAVTSGTAMGFAVKSDATRTLRSTTPS